MPKVNLLPYMEGCYLLRTSEDSTIIMLSDGPLDFAAVATKVPLGETLPPERETHLLTLAQDSLGVTVEWEKGGNWRRLGETVSRLLNVSEDVVLEDPEKGIAFTVHRVPY